RPIGSFPPRRVAGTPGIRREAAMPDAATPSARACRTWRHMELLQRFLTGVLPLPLDPRVRVVQRLGRGQQAILVEVRRPRPLLWLVAVAAGEGDAVGGPPLHLPLPDGRLGTPIMGLVVRSPTDARFLPLLGLGWLRLWSSFFAHACPSCHNASFKNCTNIGM